MTTKGVDFMFLAPIPSGFLRPQLWPTVREDSLLHLTKKTETATSGEKLRMQFPFRLLGRHLSLSYLFDISPNFELLFCHYMFYVVNVNTA